MGVQFYFGGTSLLIVVGVAMDTVQQIESQLIMRHYDGFMKKTRIRGRRGAVGDSATGHGAERHHAGPAGRRKGHAGRAAGADRGIPKISTGDILREAVKAGHRSACERRRSWMRASWSATT